MPVHKLTLNTHNTKTNQRTQETIRSDIMAIKNYTYPGFPLVTMKGSAYAYNRFLDAFHDKGQWVTKSVLIQRQKARGGLEFNDTEDPSKLLELS